MRGVVETMSVWTDEELNPSSSQSSGSKVDGSSARQS